MAFYYLALAAVVALATTKGGRYERSMALTLTSASLSSMVAQLATHQFVPIMPFTCIDLLALWSLIRLLMRYRRSWARTLVGLELAQLALDATFGTSGAITQINYLNASNSLNYGMFVTVALGVLSRRIGPPVPLPRAIRKPRAQRPAPKILFQ